VGYVCVYVCVCVMCNGAVHGLCRCVYVCMCDV